MRLLANENFPGPVVRELRGRGIDVAWVKDDMRGAADAEVLARAQGESRTLVTLDKDFGELAVRSKLPSACGVLLFRLAGSTPEHDNARMVAAVMSREDWLGCFAVVQDDRIRVRELPRS
jgi:predicted nuclease of predicted toxin-antitoxin system